MGTEGRKIIQSEYLLTAVMIAFLMLIIHSSIQSAFKKNACEKYTSIFACDYLSRLDLSSETIIP